jgi:hypothetical protein
MPPAAGRSLHMERDGKGETMSKVVKESECFLAWLILWLGGTLGGLWPP